MRKLSFEFVNFPSGPAGSSVERKNEEGDDRGLRKNKKSQRVTWKSWRARQVFLLLGLRTLLHSKKKKKKMNTGANTVAS